MAKIVLVAGSCLCGWVWERGTPLLTGAGHEVWPLTLTGFCDRAHLAAPETDLSTHTADIVNAIIYADLRNVVLVGHSYGATPVTAAAAQVADRLAGVLYLAGAVARPGGSLADLFPPSLAAGIRRSIGDGWLLPVPSDRVLDTQYAGHGLSPADREWMRARSVGHPVASYFEPLPADLSGLERLPRKYIRCAGDPAELPVPAGVEILEFDGGHWPMVTKPVETAALLGELAAELDNA